MIDRRLRTLASTLLLMVVCALAMCALAGCAGEPEKKDQPLKKAETAKPAVEVKAPSPEELAGSPCGNPDWAQLPAGAEDKAPDQQSDQQPEQTPADEPAEKEPAEEEPAEEAPAKETEEQSQRGDLYPNDKPCT